MLRGRLPRDGSLSSPGHRALRGMRDSCLADGDRPDTDEAEDVHAEGVLHGDLHIRALHADRTGVARSLEVHLHGAGRVRLVDDVDAAGVESGLVKLLRADPGGLLRLVERTLAGGEDATAVDGQSDEEQERQGDSDDERDRLAALTAAARAGHGVELLYVSTAETKLPDTVRVPGRGSQDRSLTSTSQLTVTATLPPARKPLVSTLTWYVWQLASLCPSVAATIWLAASCAPPTVRSREAARAPA